MGVNEASGNFRRYSELETQKADRRSRSGSSDLHGRDRLLETADWVVREETFARTSSVQFLKLDRLVRSGVRSFGPRVRARAGVSSARTTNETASARTGKGGYSKHGNPGWKGMSSVPGRLDLPCHRALLGSGEDSVETSNRSLKQTAYSELKEFLITRTLSLCGLCLVPCLQIGDSRGKGTSVTWLTVSRSSMHWLLRTWCSSEKRCALANGRTTSRSSIGEF
jgi:hypothetical protein